jgi:D-sedoheptulose 7-phosphate isomerase
MQFARPDLAGALFDRRVAPAERLADQAEAIADCCRAMAGRFQAGGVLLVFGNGGPSTDAQHVAVEFVHPVIVGKKSLPALSLTADIATLTGVASERGLDQVYAYQIGVLGSPSDIALGISADGECDNVIRGLAAARDAGMLTIALVGGDGGTIARQRLADHLICAYSSDVQIVKEVHVTAYHLLWELVHVFLELPNVLGPAIGAEPARIRA